MRVVRGFHDLQLDLVRPAVTIGNFDGVHRGHQQVMRAAVEAACRRGALSVVCTFEPHTMQVLRPAAAPQLLQTVEQKLSAISELGVDIAVVIPFDDSVATTGRRRFVDEFLVAELHVGSLYVSKGFSFGRGRSGRTEYLEERAAELDFDVVRVDARELEGDAVSSTRIRQAVRDGDVALAGALLGRPYAVIGEVVKGTGRGHTLGTPTANLVPDNECLPATGVYAGWVRSGPQRTPAVINIGSRPTFDSDAATHYEAHLLDFEGNLYGQELEFELVTRLRDERRFPSPDELASQIATDIAGARLQLRIATV
jgi:riboflavin kinase/FMN adenylyltransferase